MNLDETIKKLEAELARAKALKDEARVDVGGKILPIFVLHPFQTVDTMQMWVEEKKDQGAGLDFAVVLTFSNGGGLGEWHVFGRKDGAGIQVSNLLWAAEEIRRWCLEAARAQGVKK